MFTIREITMSDAVKRSKLSNETVVVNMMYDVATSVENIATSLGSLNKHHGNLLRVNKAVVGLKLDLEKEKKQNLNATVLLPEPQGNS